MNNVGKYDDWMKHPTDEDRSGIRTRSWRSAEQCATNFDTEQPLDVCSKAPSDFIAFGEF